MHIQQIKTAEELSGLAELADSWNRLAKDVPFLSWDWLEAWWRHYARPANNGDCSIKLFTLAVRDNAGRLIGLAPWYLDSSRWRGGMLRFLGTVGVCSDYLSVLCEPDREEEVTSAMSDWLTNEARGQWDLIELEGVDAADSVARQFAWQMESRWSTLDQRPGPHCWRLHLPSDWDSYLGTLSKSHRKQVRQLERRAFETGRAVLRTVECEQDLSEALKILVDLHQKRQTTLGNPGCFASPRFTAFHQEVARRFLRRGLLRLHWVEFDGRPVAIDYQIVGGRTIFAYQGGMDPKASDEWPGQLALIGILKLAIEQGYQAIDFLRGDEPYKAHWRASPRPSIRLRIVADQVSARIRHGVWAAAKALKEQVSGSLKLVGVREG